MKDWHLTLTDVNADVSGPVADMSGSLRSVRTGADTKLSVDFAAQGLPDVGKGHFKADISELTTSAADVDRLAAALTGKNLPDEVLRIAKMRAKSVLPANSTERSRPLLRMLRWRPRSAVRPACCR